MRASVLVAAIAITFVTIGVSEAACPGADEIDRFLADWTAKKPTKALSVTDMADAVCARDRLVEKLRQSQGKVVGYKAGLTAKATQERFGASAPVAGILLEKMIVNDGATVPVNFGARVVWEADMLLVVKDDGINAARTPEDVLKHISAMRPFIELPDLALDPKEKLDGVQLAAINVAARLGVAGPEVALEPSAGTVRRLAEMKIIATDGSGASLAENTGSATLGNPLNVVVWLLEELRKGGQVLKAGDLISVGSFSPLLPLKSGQTVTVRYEGLPQPAVVRVTFQ
jgi:2-keto-4-pentenoate hydratase